MKKFWEKKIMSLIVTVSVLFSAIGIIPAGAATEVGTVGDGWGYFFFRAIGLDSNCKIAYQVNGGEKIFLESDFQANWIRINKEDLKTDGQNTITFYTGNESGTLDETKSRTDAGTDCCDYTVTVARLALVLPNGRVICKDTWGALKKEGSPFTITTYTPADETTALSDANTTAEFTGAQLQIGDDKITKAYKADITFDTSLWDGTNDPEPVTVPVLKNVSVQIGATPSDRRFVWYSSSENTGYIQYTTSDKLEDGAMPCDAMQVTATSSVSGDTDYYSFMADISELADDTEYAYRVGNDDAWSEVYTFKTDDGKQPFSFIVGSDIQIGQLQEYAFESDGVSGVQKEIDGWVDTYNKISEKNPDASFFVSLGDQISDAYIESQFNGLFAPKQMTSIPFVAIYGNHDDEYSWKKHYNLPNTTEYGANNYGACDYSFVYGDALFMCLTYANVPEQHTAFIEETMKKHPDVKWRIVMFHTPFFGASTQETDDYPFRDAFVPELSRLGIDVVLGGHQHVYCRAKMMNGTTPNDSYDYTKISEIENPELSDVLYMTIGSASGSAYNNLSTLGRHVVKAWAQDEPNISNVEITDTTFKISTYKTTDMDNAADEFTLKRTGTDPVARAVLISPKNAEVKCGNSLTFTGEAFGYNLDTRAVTWSVSGNESSGTTISESGVLTVAGNETAETLTVTAASAEDSDGKTASVTVELPDNIPTVINTGKGITYQLPEKIDDVNVTWKNAAGEEVTVADTSLEGYRIYRGTLDNEDGTVITYHVNVGEYKEYMKDDFESYTQEQYTAAVSAQPLEGGTFTKDAYTGADKGATQLVKDGTNTVLAIGPYKTDYPDAEWDPAADEVGDAFKVSLKLKVVDFEPSTSSNSTHYFIQLRPKETSGVALRAKTDSSDAVTVSQIYGYSDSPSSTTSKDVECKWNTSEVDGVTKYSMEDYVTFSLAGNNVQYSAFLDDEEILNSQLWKQTRVAEQGLDKIHIGKTETAEKTNAVTYIDEVVYSKAVYVTDTLKNLAVTATAAKGDTAEQTTIVALDMSDGTTKEFTVKYTADTSKAGVQTVNGTIDGFDDVIPVTVTVEAENIIAGITKSDTAIEKATIQKVGNVVSGVAVFAYYSSDNTMTAVKAVPFTEADFTGDTAELNVNLVFSKDTEGGYIKGFVFSDATSIKPLDDIFTD